MTLHLRPRLVLAALLLAALSGCYVVPVGGYRPAYVPPPSEAVEVAPPPPQYEVIPVAPSVAHVWIGGYWNWQLGRHVWIGGRWALPPVGHYWVPHRWDRGPRGWYRNPGYWAPRRG